jgi:hypothetical protein
MISVLITASDDAQALGRLLSALVPAAADGLVRQVAVVGAVGPSAALADDAGADLFAAGAFAEAFEHARGPWVAGLPLTGALVGDWMDVLAAHLSREPPAPARLVAKGGLFAGRTPEGWLIEKRRAPSTPLAEQDLHRLTRRAGRVLRLLERR